MCIGPWNYKSRKENKNGKNLVRFKQIVMLGQKGRAREGRVLGRLIEPTPKRSKAEESYRKSQPHNVVDLNESLEQEHLKRRKQFVLRQSNRRYKTLEKE